MPLELADLVAPLGVAPRDWQSTPPDSAWESRALPVQASEDLTRVLALPRRPVLAGADAEAMTAYVTQKYTLGSRACSCAAILRADGLPARDCITVLRPVQAWALFEIGTCGGLFGPISVGHGKTLLDLLAPLAFRDCRTAALLVPPKLVDQLVLEYRLTAQHFRVPQLVVHRADKIPPFEVPGAPVLHVYPYSKLSRPDSSVFLEDVLKPDVVIADECQHLRDVNTATCSRVMRLFARRPETRLACWTGSMFVSKIEDCAHLAALSLKHRSPLPILREKVEEWSRALAYDPDRRCPPGALLSLCDPGEDIFSGFRRRLVETEGVVSTIEASIDVAQVVLERDAPEIPDVVQDALDMVRDEEKRPDGEELIDQLSVSRCAREIACGFYYKWIYPGHEFPRDEALVDDWFESRQEFNRALRSKLKKREPYLDSDYLCIQAARRAFGDLPPDPKLPSWDCPAWPRWRDTERLVNYDTEAVRLSDFLAQDAAAWGERHRGVIWYEAREFGLMISECSGLPMYVGGNKAARAIVQEDGRRSIVASITSHGTGRNGLQFAFSEQLIAQPPPSPEQLIGRLHRPGQRATQVTSWIYRHTDELRRAYDQAIMKSGFVAGVSGSGQHIQALESESE